MEFTLTIKLGNAAMQTGDDIADALRETAARVEGLSFLAEGESEAVYDVTGGVFHDTRYDRDRITDTNGNAVGEWKVS
jgi:hypothetical protein